MEVLFIWSVFKNSGRWVFFFKRSICLCAYYFLNAEVGSVCILRDLWISLHRYHVHTLSLNECIKLHQRSHAREALASFARCWNRASLLYLTGGWKCHSVIKLKCTSICQTPWGDINVISVAVFTQLLVMKCFWDGKPFVSFCTVNLLAVRSKWISRDPSVSKMFIVGVKFIYRFPFLRVCTQWLE